MIHNDIITIQHAHQLIFLQDFEKAVNEGWRVSNSNMGYPILTTTLFEITLTATPEDVKETNYVPLTIDIIDWDGYELMANLQGAILQGYTVVDSNLGHYHSVTLKRTQKQAVVNTGGSEVVVDIPLLKYYTQPELRELSYQELKLLAQQPEVDAFHRDKAIMLKQVWQKLRTLFKKTDIE